MKATHKNERIAREIIKILAENKCTVENATEILAYASKAIQHFATVPRIENKLFED